jgi:hypothetical protein
MVSMQKVDSRLLDLKFFTKILKQYNAGGQLLIAEKEEIQNKLDDSDAFPFQASAGVIYEDHI